MTNVARLLRLRKAIDKADPVDGIHNEEVRDLFENGGECPRYLGCTSEGSEESSYRDNPDFFVADSQRDVGKWLAGSYCEGWAARWVLDLATGEGLDWAVYVQTPTRTRMPFVIDTLALTGAANDVLIERKQSDALVELVDAVAEVVNRALGREPGLLDRTKVLIGVKRPEGAPA